MAYATKRRREPVRQGGTGVLEFPGFKGEVEYELIGVLKGLRPGGPGLKGSVMTSLETAKEAFSAGHGHLQLEDGRSYRVTMLGHTAGSTVTYFELTV